MRIMGKERVGKKGKEVKEAKRWIRCEVRKETKGEKIEEKYGGLTEENCYEEKRQNTSHPEGMMHKEPIRNEVHFIPDWFFKNNFHERRIPHCTYTPLSLIPRPDISHGQGGGLDE